MKYLARLWFLIAIVFFGLLMGPAILWDFMLHQPYHFMRYGEFSDLKRPAYAMNWIAKQSEKMALWVEKYGEAKV